MKIIDEKRECIVCNNIKEEGRDLCYSCHLHFIGIQSFVLNASEKVTEEIIKHLKNNRLQYDHTDLRCCTNCRHIQYGSCLIDSQVTIDPKGFCNKWSPDGLNTKDRMEKIITRKE